MATWRVIDWIDRPTETGDSIPMECECGKDADVPCGQLVGGTLIAVTGDNDLIFDPPWFAPPDNWLPTAIQCRKCGCKLVSKLEEVK